MGSTAVMTSERGRRRSDDGWSVITSLALDGIASPHTRRALETKVSRHPVNVRPSAIRRLALEAADNGLIAPELPTGIARTKSAKRINSVVDGEGRREDIASIG